MHPMHDESKRSHAYRMRGVAGAGSKVEYPPDRARRIAGVVAEDRRVVGDPSPANYVEAEQK